MSSRLFFSGKGNYVVWADDKKHFVLWLCIRIWRDDSIFVHLTRAVTRVLRYQSAEFQFLLYLLFFLLTLCNDTRLAVTRVIRRASVSSLLLFLAVPF